ncbi:hypothetical protein LCGC14_2387600, partial [marine sediment metagenome]
VNLGDLVHEGDLVMGGTNQATCQPPKSRQTGTPAAKSKQVHSLLPRQANPVRFHEVTSRGEVDFHDDMAGMKCAMDSAAFFDAYNKWRPKMSDDLTLAGNDGKGGHSSVTLVPYMDDQGEMQVAMAIKKASVGQTICDLDKLAHFS